MKFLPVLLLLSIPFWLTAKPQWPIRNLTDALISSVFGESRTDHFHNGIDISLDKAPIYPVENGEVIFYWDSARALYPEEQGMGNMIAIQHPKFRSYYCHLKEISRLRENLIGQSTQIGVVGNTGRSSGAHLHFSVKDEKQYQNPVEMLPKIKDTTPPVIKTLVFRSGYYLRMIPPAQNQRIFLPLRNSYEILFLAQDPGPGGRKKGIYSFRLQITDLENKEIVFRKEVVFDTLRKNKISGKYSFNDLFSVIWNEGFLIAGEWVKKNRRDDYLLELTITDSSGNTDSMKKQISFR